MAAADDGRPERDRGTPRRRRALQRRRRDQHRRARRADRACCRPSSIAPARWRTPASPRRGSSAPLAAMTASRCRADATPSKSAPDPRGSATFVAVDDVSFDVSARRDLRLPRQQRRRQVDDDPHAVRAAAADVGHAPSSAASTSARDPEGVKQRIGYMSQRFSLYELLTVDQNIRFFGGIYGLDRRRWPSDGGVRARDGRACAGASTRSPRDLAGRLAAAAGARLRHSPRAGDPLSRRADRRRRSAVAPPVLAPDRRAARSRASPCWSRPTIWTRPSAATAWR